MKDQGLLLLAGIVAAGAAWAFWRYIGEYGALVIQTIVIISLFADNYRLRRILREHGLAHKERSWKE
jgi:hypothetical protein